MDRTNILRDHILSAVLLDKLGSESVTTCSMSGTNTLKYSY